MNALHHRHLTAN